MSLRARMGLAAGVAVALAVLAVSVSAYLGTRSAVIGQIDTSLLNLAAQIEANANGTGNHDVGGAFGSSPTGTPPGAANPFRATLGTSKSSAGGSGSVVLPAPNANGDCNHNLGLNQPGSQAWGGARGTTQLVTPSGAVCGPDGSKQVIPVTAAALRIARSGHGQAFIDETGGKIALRVLVEGASGGDALMIALPLTGANSTLAHELLLMALIAAGGIAFAALLGFLVARAAVAPISRFTRQTERIATSPERVEHERLIVTGHDELARLARTFNATLDALEGSIAAQRNLVADASHELRTPISTLRANLQLLRDEHLLTDADRDAVRADMIEELDELTRLVGDVVELARGTKASGEPGEVRLDQITTEAIDRARRRAPRLDFHAELDPTLVRGDGERIARAVSNLLDNAMKWSPEGERVEITLRDDVLTVRDHGPGFHEQDLPFVFDRFHRARDARSKPGSGLGLAIVRQATEAHGGFSEAGNASDGGAVLRVSFGQGLPIAVDALAALADAPQ